MSAQILNGWVKFLNENVRRLARTGGVQAVPWRRNAAGVTPSLQFMTRVMCAWSAKPQADAIALTGMAPCDSRRLARNTRSSMM